ncbi:MAG: DUF3568 family protein [Nitrospiraceae bacterium]|nr:DUF3568 family protein [Nitrospiraceae bacterium]
MKAGRRRAYLRLLAGLPAIMLFLTGCVAVLAGGAVGGGTYAYLNGKLSQDLDRPVPKVYGAAMDTLKDFHLPVVKDAHDSLSARIESRFADGANIWIKIDSETVSDSRISVRVGLLGDKSKSRELVGCIDSHLNLSPWDKARVNVMAKSRSGLGW